MKTPIKILLLILFTVGAIAGVLIFAKTQVAPPSEIKSVNQYANNLQTACASFDSIDDFSQSRREFTSLADKVKRFSAEQAIDNETADKYQKRIYQTFGERLTTESYNLIQTSVWSDRNINEMQGLMKSLMNNRLSNGELAVSNDFVSSANQYNAIIDRYHAAQRLSRNTSFNSISDASDKLSKARSFRSDEYLRKNAALVSALDAMPSRIAQAHYNYVASNIGSLANYRSMTEDQYTGLIRRIDNIIEEYKGTEIYGNNKPSVSGLVDRASALIDNAMSYYED